MGLLDDAIREHLELKRLRGADPGEVAREQHEALDPVPRDERAASDLDLEGVGDTRSESVIDESPPAGASYAPDQPAAASGPTEETGSANDLTETAELDMGTLLDDDHEAAASHASSSGQAGVGAMQDGPEALGEEDSLEWVVPGDSADSPATDRGDRREEVLQQPRDPLPESPGQERLRFDQRPSGESEREA